MCDNLTKFAACSSFHMLFFKFPHFYRLSIAFGLSLRLNHAIKFN